MAVNDEAVEAATFEEVFADKPEAEKPSEGGVARDEQGRFAQKEEPAKAEVAETPASEDEGAIPPWRLRELREERDRVAERAEAAERRATEYERQLVEYRRQQAEAAKPKQERPDSILDPDGYTEYLRQDTRSVAQQIRTELEDRWIEMTAQAAKKTYGEEFTTAWEAMTAYAKRDHQFLLAMRREPNPAEAAMEWYREQEARREIGGDIKGYLKRKQDEWVQDPEVRKRVFEAMDAEARGSNGVARSSNVTDLPSLNRATGSGGSRSDAGLGGSDSERFQNVYSRKR